MMKKSFMPLHQENWKENTYHVRPIKLHFNLDSDRDGVLDHLDCSPFNPTKHVLPGPPSIPQQLQQLQKTEQQPTRVQGGLPQRPQQPQLDPKWEAARIRSQQPRQPVQQQPSPYPTPAYTKGSYTYYYPPNPFAHSLAGKIFGWK